MTNNSFVAEVTFKSQYTTDFFQVIYKTLSEQVIWII